MEPEFWQGMWRDDRIAFHEPRVNRLLQRHWAALDPLPSERVLVPLCGKALDMPWLVEQGHAITAIDLSPIAVETFFAERGMSVTPTPDKGLQRYEVDAYRLYAGDFFCA